jgi:hypothetical protein
MRIWIRNMFLLHCFFPWTCGLGHQGSLRTCGLIITNFLICDLRTGTPQKFADMRLRNKYLRIYDFRTSKQCPLLVNTNIQLYFICPGSAQLFCYSTVLILHIQYFSNIQLIGKKQWISSLKVLTLKTWEVNNVTYPIYRIPHMNTLLK